MDLATGIEKRKVKGKTDFGYVSLWVDSPHDWLP